MHPLTDISNTWFHGSYSSGLLQINSWCKRDIQLRVICIIACEHSLLFGRVKWVSRERASERWSREGPRKGELTTISHKFHLYFTQTKGNTIGWKMTFRKSKLIDNRLSWHPLRLCVKFGSQGDEIGTEKMFQPSKRTGSFDVILVKRILRAEDKSDRVSSSCGRKMKTLHHWVVFVCVKHLV